MAIKKTLKEQYDILNESFDYLTDDYDKYYLGYHLDNNEVIDPLNGYITHKHKKWIPMIIAGIHYSQKIFTLTPEEMLYIAGLYTKFNERSVYDDEDLRDAIQYLKSLNIKWIHINSNRHPIKKQNGYNVFAQNRAGGGLQQISTIPTKYISKEDALNGSSYESFYMYRDIPSTIILIKST